MEIEFNEQKFKELILYIATQCKDDARWGATKLNKQLFFADFLAYGKLGYPITGAEYMALERGPAPKRLLPIREAMIEDGDICLERRGYQERIVADRQPDLAGFSPQELELVNYVIGALRDNDAEEVSNLSHQFLGWMAARAEGLAKQKNIIIPYGTVFVSRPTLTEEERVETLDMARKHGWRV